MAANDGNLGLLEKHLRQNMHLATHFYWSSFLVVRERMMFLIYLQVFPIVPLQTLGISTPVQAAAEGHTRRRLRLCATWFTLLLGMALAAVGLALSARIGTQPQGDPLLPGSPVMFLAGVVCMLASALVFELFPSAKSTAS